MANANIISLDNVNLNTGRYQSQADTWGTDDSTMNNPELNAGKFMGYCLNWNGFTPLQVLGSFNNNDYAGYTSNFAASDITNTVDVFKNTDYAGYTTNWGKYVEPIERSVEDIDKDTIIKHPKDQIIYYKLRGWNPLTSSYESWIVSHDITGRPALDGGLFDPNPGKEPPNYERDVFKTPPSGNALTGIIIVSRWFE